MAMSDGYPVLEAQSFSKTFSGRTVLRDVNVDVLPGEVHGLLGQNGSGKSTLIKILSGYHAPDDGTSMKMFGKPVSLPLAPGDPEELGMSFVHQDLGLVDSMSVLETLHLGRYETRWGWRIPWRSERQVVEQALDSFDLQIDPDATIGSLRNVDRAMVAILRSLEQLKETSTGLLVLDEPTAYLPRDGVEQLFETVRAVSARGIGVLFVTHRLEEVRLITDRVSILRDGALVETARTSSLSQDEIIDRILGFSLGDLYPEPHESQGKINISVDDLSGSKMKDFSLDLHVGEVVGVTGLLGMGHEEIPYLLFGAEKAETGCLTIGEMTYDLKEMLPQKAIAAGMALLPGNRLRDGAVGAASVTENMTLTTLRSYFAGGILRHRKEDHRVRDLLSRFQVQPPEPERLFGTFSGGNQQKVLVGKWLETSPKLLLLHEPTQGVDVGAKREIFARIRDSAESGTSIIIASSEYEDIANLCDRVIVFRDGWPVSELRGSSLTEERIVEQCFREREERKQATQGVESPKGDSQDPADNG